MALLVTWFSGCGSLPEPRDGPPAEPPDPGEIADAVPRAEPRSRYGNPPHYEVFGRRYYVLPESRGYRERGVASWYGSKFHGRRTSSGEPFDMYAMTAAHKTLPLPAYARVTNLRNGRAVVVKINDRGPFVDNRLIDLSYAAALRLDLVRDGTGLVEVQVLDPVPVADDTGPIRAGTDTFTPDRNETGRAAIGRLDPEPVAASLVAAPAPVTTAATASHAPAPHAAAASPARSNDVALWMQIGAFADALNATRLLDRLTRHGIGGAAVFSDASAPDALYRVRVGPIADVAHYDAVLSQLRALGVDRTHLVTD